MNNKLTLFAGCVGSLVLAGTVTAGYEGLSYEVHADEGVAGTWTARIYANFSDENDQLNAVYGDADNPLSVDSTDGFYQNAFGGATSSSINPALYPAFPSLVYDSWATIGLEDNVDNAMGDIGIDWAPFLAGGAIETNNGTWFTTPADAQSLAGPEMRVMIAQLTTFKGPGPGSGVIFGHVSLQGKTAGGDTWVSLNDQFAYALPAPGAMALLGLAGFAGRRRRA
jgi:hypothetical protein